MPVTEDVFRRLALSFTGAVEMAHMNHPDFRVNGRIFATLGHPKKGFGMVKLTPDQQDEFVHDFPAVFTPVPDAWGRKGCTHVRLKAATRELLRPAMQAAWQNASSKPPSKPTGRAHSRKAKGLGR